MIESHINSGRQDIPSESEGGPKGLKYGVSITDACVDWDQTVTMLKELNEAVGVRKELVVLNKTKTKETPAPVTNGVH